MSYVYIYIYIFFLILVNKYCSTENSGHYLLKAHKQQQLFYIPNSIIKQQTRELYSGKHSRTAAKMLDKET